MISVLSETGEMIKKPTQISGRTEEYKLLKVLKKRLTAKGGSYVAMSRMFKEIDLDGNGLIDFDEFSKGMETLEMMLSRAKVEMLFGYFDADGGGNIDMNEFIAGKKLRHTYTKQK